MHASRCAMLGLLLIGTAMPVSPPADAWLSAYLGLACRLVRMPDASQRFSNPRYAGGGKGVGAVFPNLLDYPGAILVTDIKGENYAVTARYRHEVLHQPVAALDPFGLVGFDGAGVGLSGHADCFERVQDWPALDFQFPCQIVDSNFAHPSLFTSLRA